MGVFHAFTGLHLPDEHLPDERSSIEEAATLDYRPREGPRSGARGAFELQHSIPSNG